MPWVIMSETEIPQVLDQQEARLAERNGTLHRTLSQSWPEDPDKDDVVWCGTCGTDLRNLAFCPDVPTGRCGCPLFMIFDGEHLPHE